MFTSRLSKCTAFLLIKYCFTLLELAFDSIYKQHKTYVKKKHYYSETKGAFAGLICKFNLINHANLGIAFKQIS